MAELQRNSGKGQDMIGMCNKYIVLVLGIVLVTPGFASDPSICFSKETASTLSKERYSAEAVDASLRYNGVELINATASKRIEQ